VVAVTRFGDAAADAVVAHGVADATISRPLLRSEIEELLRRVAAGETPLHSAATGRQGEAALSRFANLRVLVADDNAVNREVAIEALSRLGARVETVENGVEAVGAASAQSYDIILMDGSMPQMDGFAATRMIRQAEASGSRNRVPIVALTAHVVGAAADEWRSAGMDAILYKPFTLAQLARCLTDQVPQFQTYTGEPQRAADGDLVKREVKAETPNPDNAAARLLDADTLGQLQAMNAAGQGDFFKRVADLYCEHAPNACLELTQHATTGEAAACARLAHSLKSMSLNIGAVQVANMASDFEARARGDGWVPDQDALAALSSVVERTSAAIAAIAERSSARQSGVASLATPALVVAVGRLEDDLHGAIERRELDVAYQPLVDRVGRRVLGVEALVRWRRGGVDNVPPSVFVPIAERTGFIGEMGEWVLRRACKDALGWPDLTVAVNVSPLQFRLSGLADRIERVLSESAVDPTRVVLEITETATLDAEAAVRRTIEQLHHRGVSFALDDFGTGYSSLTCLRRFPFDEIKIDRSFVSNVGLTIDATIVHAVVSIGRALGLKVVAEGVETTEQQTFLKAAGVYAMQGYLFARPMNSGDVAAFLASFDERFQISGAL
jgi:EAL domain-containing protein (putative c-di-GMP-specific phosphodiesterase class I)/CheY-like chemotaxis protein